jgi:hypothetical protein
LLSLSGLDTSAIDTNQASRGANKASKRLKQSGLASPIHPDQATNATRRQMEAGVIERHRAVVINTELIGVDAH